MADYFQEMGWEEIDPENIDRHQSLLLARFLSANGFFGDYPNFNADQLPPPASEELVKNLPEKKCTSSDEKCAICLKPNTDDSEEIFKILPCNHAFHNTCILPWLEKVSTIRVNKIHFINSFLCVDKFLSTL